MHQRKMELKCIIEKLTGTVSWKRWKRQITLTLKHHGVLGVATGDDAAPEELDDDATEEERLAYENVRVNYEKCDAKAQVIMINAMDDDHVEITATCETAYETWCKLLSIYEQTSSQRLDRTLEQFFTANLSEGEELVKYIGRLQATFKEVNEELEKYGTGVLPEIVLMSRIMSTLPSAFFEFKSVWESIPVENRSVELLTERVRLIEGRLGAKGGNERTVGEAFQTEKKFNGKKSKKKSTLKCFVCNGPHRARVCPHNPTQKKTEDDESSSRKGLLCFVANGAKSAGQFIADSGATHHMCYEREFFTTYSAFTSPMLVTVANGDSVQALGEGDIKVDVKCGKIVNKMMLKNVWYVPKLGRNLFSVSAALEKGYEFLAKGTGCKLKKGDVQVNGLVRNGLFELDMEVLAENGVYAAEVKKTLQQWHECLAHQNKAHVLKFLKQRGINPASTDMFCEACVLGKQHRETYRSRTVKPTEPGEIISADLCGPMEQKSLGGKLYALVLKDYVTKFRKVFFLREKTEVAEHLEIFLNEGKTAGNVIKTLMTDNGTEFVNVRVTKILNDRGITHRRSMPYTPEENGSVEREMRTLVESARTMLQGDLPLSLWAEAMNTACHVINWTGPMYVVGKDTV